MIDTYQAFFSDERISFSMQFPFESRFLDLSISSYILHTDLHKDPWIFQSILDTNLWIENASKYFVRQTRPFHEITELLQHDLLHFVRNHLSSDPSSRNPSSSSSSWYSSYQLSDFDRIYSISSLSWTVLILTLLFTRIPRKSSPSKDVLLDLLQSFIRSSYILKMP